LTQPNNIDAQRVLQILIELYSNINLTSNILPETLQVVKEEQLLIDAFTESIQS
jgi:hypothetical protein